jgi:D-glycero-alpha-D-manno-heptose 1-phosphate guanylyltransferase
VVSDLPKPLAPIRGVPFLSYLLAYLEAQGVPIAILSTGYMGEKIEAQFGSRFGSMRLAYCPEPEPLGTGGAIRLAMETFDPGPAVFAMNGDSYFPMALAELEQAGRNHPEAAAVLALKYMDRADRYGTVALLDSNRISRFEEKGATMSGHINAGIYRLDRSFLDRTPAGSAFSIERDYFEILAPSGTLIGVPSEVDFIDIGVPYDLERAQTLLPLFSAAPPQGEHL